MVHQGGRAGNVDASTTLGICTARRRSAQDYKEAVSGTPRLPSGEMSTLSTTLGLCTTTERVPKDLVQAYAWWWCCKSQRTREGQGVEDKIELTPLQFAEAQSLYTEIYKRIGANRQD